jgi:hypothetical protein
MTILRRSGLADLFVIKASLTKRFSLSVSSLSLFSTSASSSQGLVLERFLWGAR